MGLNEPTPTLNIFKMILYELKMDLDNLKWLSLNQLKRALISSNFNDFYTNDVV